MSKHKASSDAGYSSVQFTSQTEQTEFLSNSESVGFENKAYDMSSTIKTKVDAGISRQDQSTNDKRESIASSKSVTGEKKTTEILESLKQDKELVLQIEANTESANREISLTNRIDETKQLEEGERSIEQEKQVVEERRQEKKNIDSSSRTDDTGNKPIFDEVKKQLDNSLESKHQSQIKEVTLQSDRKSKDTGEMPTPQREPETATMVSVTNQHTNTKDDDESESNDVSTRRASELLNGKAENVRMSDLQKVKADNLFTTQTENIEEPHKVPGNDVHYEDDHWHHDDDAILLHSEVTSQPHEAHLELNLQKEESEALPQGGKAPKKKKTSKFPFSIFQK